MNWFLYEFWRFVFVQQQVGKLAQTALEYPPMQQGASFNLDALKAELIEGWPEDGVKNGSQNYMSWFLYEFWRFVFVQQQVGKLAQTCP